MHGDRAWRARRAGPGCRGPVGVPRRRRPARSAGRWEGAGRRASRGRRDRARTRPGRAAWPPGRPDSGPGARRARGGAVGVRAGRRSRPTGRRLGVGNGERHRAAGLRTPPLLPGPDRAVPAADGEDPLGAEGQRRGPRVEAAELGPRRRILDGPDRGDFGPARGGQRPPVGGEGQVEGLLRAGQRGHPAGGRRVPKLDLPPGAGQGQRPRGAEAHHPREAPAGLEAGDECAVVVQVIEPDLVVPGHGHQAVGPQGDGRHLGLVVDAELHARLGGPIVGREEPHRCRIEPRDGDGLAVGADRDQRERGPVRGRSRRG